MRSSGCAANPLESLCHCVTSPFGKGRLTISLRRFHQFPFANLRLLRSHRRASRGRRLSVQYRRQLGPGSRVLCRPPAFQGRRLTYSSFTALFDTNRPASSRAEAACHVTLFLKIATASMSREIFLVNDYDGGFKERFESNIES